MNEIRIVSVKTHFDLRTLKSTNDFLWVVVKQHKLRSGEAVVFANKDLTRYRMVLRIGSVATLCTPHIDTGRGREVFRAVTKKFATVCANSESAQVFQDLKDLVDVRIENQKKWRAKHGF